MSSWASGTWKLYPPSNVEFYHKNNYLQHGNLEVVTWPESYSLKDYLLLCFIKIKFYKKGNPETKIKIHKYEIHACEKRKRSISATALLIHVSEVNWALLWLQLRQGYFCSRWEQVCLRRRCYSRSSHIIAGGRGKGNLHFQGEGGSSSQARVVDRIVG